MKKTALLIAAALATLSVFCSVPVLAAESSSSQKRTIGVYAKSVYTLPNGCYGTEKDDDGYVAKLPDGTKFTVTPKSGNSSFRIVIVPITKKDKKAYKWISERTTGLGTDPLFYDIYFADEYGNRVEADGTFDVSIDLIEGYRALKAAGISADGTLAHLVSKSGQNQISFTIEKGGYYAIASGKDDQTAPTVSPKTGENGFAVFGVALLAVFSAGVLGTVMYCRKKKHS